MYFYLRREFEPEQSPKLYAVIETLVRKGIERHDSFDAHTNCVSYSTEAASALRRQFAEQWRNVLLEAIDADRDIDSTVLDKFVEALGILNYMYDPVADGKQNPVGRMALDAVPNYHLRAHAKYNGLPAMCPSLVEAIVSEGTLEDVESSVFARLAVLETAAPRGESGGGGSVFNSAMIGGVIRCLPPGVGAYPIASNKAEVRMLWDPIIRYLIPWRALQQLPIGKVSCCSCSVGRAYNYNMSSWCGHGASACCGASY